MPHSSIGVKLKHLASVLLTTNISTMLPFDNVDAVNGSVSVEILGDLSTEQSNETNKKKC